MVSGMTTGYPHGLDKGLGSKFCDCSRLQEGSRFRKEDSRVRQEMHAEGRRAHRLKRCTDNNEDEDNSPNNADNPTQNLYHSDHTHTYYTYTHTYGELSYCER